MPRPPRRRVGAALRPPWRRALAAALCAALTLQCGQRQPPFAAPRAARRQEAAARQMPPRVPRGLAAAGCGEAFAGRAPPRPASPRAEGGAAQVARHAGDPWSVLDVRQGSTVNEIKAAFRSKIRACHPDRGGSPEQFQRVKQAYEDALDAARTIGQGSSQSGLWPSATSSAGSRHRAWTMQDFYAFRREQLQREQEDWDRDAAFGRQGQRSPRDEPPERREEQGGDWVSQRWAEYARAQPQEHRDWRQRWRGSEQRVREETARRREQEEAQRREQEELQEALRRERAAPPRRAAAAAAGPDMWGGKWGDFDLGRGPPATSEKGKAPAAAQFFSGGGVPPQRRPRPRAAAPPEQEATEDGDQQGGDPAVGYRTVSTTAGRVRVPVFQDASGSMYYTSPLTSKRVSLPR